MYFIFLCLFLAALGITFLFPNISVLTMFDSVTLIQTLLMLIPVLIAARMEKDLLCALRHMVSKSAVCSVKQLKRCEEAVSLTIKFALCSGILTFLILFIIILRSVNLQDSSWKVILSANFSTALLSVIYPLFLCCLLLPVHARIHGELIDIAPDSAASHKEPL